MRAAKSRIKRAAVLHNLRDLKPVPDCQTRWSAKIDMLLRFGRIKDELVEESKHEDAEIQIDDSIHFLSKVSTFRRMLDSIYAVANQLQAY